MELSDHLKEINIEFSAYELFKLSLRSAPLSTLTVNVLFLSQSQETVAVQSSFQSQLMIL